MRRLLAKAGCAAVLLAGLCGQADAGDAAGPATGGCETQAASLCAVDPGDAGCRPPLDRSTAERWLSDRKDRLAAAKQAMNDAETAQKVAQAHPSGAQPAAVTTDRPTFAKAQEEFLLQRHCVAQAELYVRDLKVNLGQVHMWRQRLSVGMFGGRAAGNASQVGVWVGRGWTVSPDMEAEIAIGPRLIQRPDAEASDGRTLWTLRLRSLFGGRAPVYVGAALAMSDVRHAGAGTYAIPEFGAMFRMTNQRICDENGSVESLVPWGIGVSIEPVIPLKGDSGPVMVMFNLTAELGTNAIGDRRRLLELDTFDEWYGGDAQQRAARESLGCKRPTRTK
jgi:hypothetical protein